MTVTVADVTPSVLTARMRFPFHFGSVAVDRSVHVLVELDVEIDGGRETGVAMGGLHPGWFFKEPDMTVTAGVEAMIDSFRTAWEASMEVEAETPFAFRRALYDEQRRWAAGRDPSIPPLAWNYGVSLVECALIDAACRYHDVPFARAVRKGLLGIDPGAIYDELDGIDPADLLPDEPTREIALRHTVGLTDPLTDADLTDSSADEHRDDERPDGDLPHTLREQIEAYGVDRFKIKLSSDSARDRERLRRIAGVLDDSGLDSYAVSLDANEGYGTVREFRRDWERLTGDPALDTLLDSLLYVEQPLARNAAFGLETARVLREWDEVPVIIDESDDRPGSLKRALDCGYAGTSHKNCKGVFEGVVNRCLIERRRRTDPEGTYLMSTEDLTTLGPIELSQDLAVAATLGVSHVERNGHHYYRGLDPFPGEIVEETLAAHGDLYRRHEAGFATLAVDDGVLNLDSVVDAPFGRAVDVDSDRFTPLSERDIDDL
jgi:L-alanine-DL-glutamate epimerase-like enolase superfamily enzyme